MVWITVPSKFRRWSALQCMPWHKSVCISDQQFGPNKL